MPAQFLIQGRIVWGHPGKLSPKKDNQKKNIIKDGQPVMQCAFGIAIERNTFYQTVLPHMINEARTAFPQANFDGRQFTGVPPKFAWKYKDGDTDIDDKGKPYNQREGYAGHCILTISTQGFAPSIFKSNGAGGYVQMTAEEVKCGDFAAVNITVKYNGSTGTNTPGLYVNPNSVMHIGYGQAIESAGQDPEEAFAGFQPQQFAGMTQQPQMPIGAVPSAMQPGHQPVQAGYAPQQQAGYPQPAQNIPNAVNAGPYQPQPGQMPPPAHDFVQNATGQQQYGAPQPGNAPVQYAPAPQMNHGQPPAQPGYAPQQGNPAMGYPSNQPQQQPMQYGQPGQMPGLPPGR